jgi:hypothetical protein
MTAMQAESLEVLEKADVAPAQARAIVRAIEIQMYTAILGQMAVLLGFAYFFATHVR